MFVELKEHSTPELGVVLSPDGGNVTVRLRNRLLTTSVGICTPITKEPQSQSKTNAQSRNNMRIGEPITHFISLDLESTNVVKRIQKLQEDLGHIEGELIPLEIDRLLNSNRYRYRLLKVGSNRYRYRCRLFRTKPNRYRCRLYERKCNRYRYRLIMVKSYRYRYLTDTDTDC